MESYKLFYGIEYASLSPTFIHAHTFLLFLSPLTTILVYCLDFTNLVMLNSAKFRVLYIFYYQLIGLLGRVFANDPGDLGSIPGRVIPKTLEMVLDTSLLNTQQYKVRIKGKVEQLRERSSALPYTSVL